jgi:hypothetical protein
MKMKKIKLVFAVMLAVGLFAGATYAQVSDLNEPGSVLVFPLIDNINGMTWVDIVNRGDEVVVQGLIIAHNDSDVFYKYDFNITLTENQPLLWDTSKSLSHGGGFVQSFDGLKGYMVIWAIEDDGTQEEKLHNELIGSALQIDVAGKKTFKYLAIPHQAATITRDRVLEFNGTEYSQASETILCEGISAGYCGIQGKLVVANLNVDLITSSQPEFNINFGVYNDDEIFSSRHKHFEQFEQYCLGNDLGLKIGQLGGSPVFQFSTSADGNPLWAVMFQKVANFAWGSQCYMDPDGAADATLTLAPVTQQ